MQEWTESYAKHEAFIVCVKANHRDAGHEDGLVKVARPSCP